MTRYDYNIKIIEFLKGQKEFINIGVYLEKFVNDFPDQRFGQIVYNYIDSKKNFNKLIDLFDWHYDPFYEESVETWSKIGEVYLPTQWTHIDDVYKLEDFKVVIADLESSRIRRINYSKLMVNVNKLYFDVEDTIRQDEILGCLSVLRVSGKTNIIHKDTTITELTFVKVGSINIFGDERGLYIPVFSNGENIEVLSRQELKRIEDEE